MRAMWQSVAVAVMVGMLTVGASAQAKQSVFVNLTSDEGQRVTMALNFSNALLKDGQDVTVFLNVDGVFLGSTKVAGLAAQRTELQAFMKAGGKVIICAHCMQVRGVATTDLLPGLATGTDGSARQAFLASTRQISY
jgi:sulfur relay (sulfurtransferase) complex TusBCD TusD component (DsrE family)